MSIKISSSPADSFNKIAPTIRLLHHQDLGTNLPTEEDHPHFLPHKVYNFSLEEILHLKSLDDAKLESWRYVFQDEAENYHIAEVSVSSSGDSHRLHHIDSGEIVDDFIDAYTNLAAHNSEIHYELNLLRIPSCFVTAIWLKGDDHHHELLIPLEPMPDRLRSETPFDPLEFTHIVESIARQLLASPPIHQIQNSNDDLMKIEGIGAKSAEYLKNAGYSSFKSVANASPEALKAALAKMGSSGNFINTSTWPEQAKLAAAGKWEDLKILQDELIGGKRN